MREAAEESGLDVRDVVSVYAVAAPESAEVTRRTGNAPVVQGAAHCRAVGALRAPFVSQ